jgi:hypothetical protein
MEDLEFDGTILGLDLAWSYERKSTIERGESDPNSEETDQWRKAMCRSLATNWQAWTVWIVPMRIDNATVGYALFQSPTGATPEDAPMLEGVYDRLEEVKALLAAQGVVHSQ